MRQTVFRPRSCHEIHHCRITRKTFSKKILRFHRSSQIHIIIEQDKMFSQIRDLMKLALDALNAEYGGTV